MSSEAPLIDVDRVAALAHLELTDQEREMFARQLAAILAFADQVREVDTSAVPPTAHALAGGGIRRRDEPLPSLPRDAALANAPDAARESGLFKVPRVIGG